MGSQFFNNHWLIMAPQQPQKRKKSQIWNFNERARPTQKSTKIYNEIINVLSDRRTPNKLEIKPTECVS